MQELKPLLDDVRTIKHSGRFDVQLEIPGTSTLTQSEIEKILTMASWETNPRTIADGYEPYRSVLVQRERPIIKQGLALHGLQVSGIGHGVIERNNGRDITFIDMNGEFSPPSTGNYMDFMGGTIMSTGDARGREFVSTRPKYRALGTYTAKELSDKVRNTMEASSLQLRKLVVPHVEAYGRYLNPELANEEGNFGFIVSPIPDVKKERVIAQAMSIFENGITKDTVIPEALMRFYAATSLPLAELVSGLRELHDVGRVAHLQPHLSNVYLADGKVFLVDWGTMTRLGNDPDENILRRVLDIKKPMDNYVAMFHRTFAQLPDLTKVEMDAKIMELVLEVYSGNPGKEVKAVELAGRMAEVYGKHFSDIDAMKQWMKDQGIEGFPKHTKEVKKIGRNEPCPCGSGKKYKKCCLV